MSGYRAEVIPGGLRVGLVAALAILILAVGVRIVAPGAVSALATPLWSTGMAATAAVGNSLSFSSAASKQAALVESESERTALAAQNAVLAARVADLERLLGGRESSPGILASVHMRPPTSPYDVLGIDRGEEAGIREGMPVAGPGGTPIGRISEVEAARSRVVLYSSTGVSTEGWAGAERVPVTLTGMGAGAFRASVPREAGIMIGDGIYVPASGAAPIGSVISIDSDPSSPIVELHVRPYTNPFSLTWVSVIAE